MLENHTNIRTAILKAADSIERHPEFWQRVIIRPEPECWNWTGYVGVHGYGRLKWKSQDWTAHRLAYTFVNGEIPKTQNRFDNVIMHTCDNRICCNPNHLILGTSAENIADAKRKGRYQRKENDPRIKRGSENGFARLTESDVSIIKALCQSGALQQKIADYFNVSVPCISAIHVGRNWSHVPETDHIPKSVRAIFESGEPSHV